MKPLRAMLLVVLGVVIGATTATIRSHRSPLSQAPAFARVSGLETELDRRVAEVNLVNAPFDEAVDAVRKLTRVQIDVDDAGLRSAGANRRTPVTMRGQNVPLGDVLGRMVEADPNIAWGVSHGRILISTPDRLVRTSYVQSYDVRGLLDSVWLREDPDSPTTIVEFPASVEQRPTSRGEALARLIEDTVTTDTWMQNGGSGAWIHYLNGRLFVVHQWEGHRQIRKLLRQLAQPAPPLPLEIPEPTWNRWRKQWIASEPAARLESVLQIPIAEGDIRDATLDHAVAALRSLASSNIVIDRASLNVAGFDASTRLDFNLKNTSLGRALSVLLGRPFGRAHLDYTLDDGLITITTRAGAERSPGALGR